MKFYLSESKTKKGDKGLFAGSDISEGTVLFIDHELQSKERTKYFEADYRQSEQSKMIQYAQPANTALCLSDRDKRIERLAVKNIKKDEELTGDAVDLTKMKELLGYV